MSRHDPRIPLRSIALVLMAALGCAREGSEARHSATTPSPTSTGEAVSHDPAGSVHEPSGPSAPTEGACAAERELARMDTRRPVPLQPMMAWHQKQNMMEHLVAIQRITDGLARQDWDEVAAASALIEPSPQRERMCEHMGAGAEGFTEAALDFHRRAEAIGDAARAEDGPAVLRATAHTLAACTSCHATYRQDVMDAASWEQRTGSSHDPAAMHGH